MKLFYFKLMLLLFVSAQVMGQTRTVTGVVLDATDGTGLAGVNVTVKGSGEGTATDTDGKFSLRAPAAATTLVISFVGYTTQEVAIPESNNVSINLESSAS